MKLILIFCVFFSSSSFAVLNVLHDSGESVPIRPFLDGLVPANIDMDSVVREAKKMSQFKYQIISGTTYFPIETPEMSAGKVIHRKMNLPTFQTPLCLIGDDRFSYEWFSNMSEKLAQFNTVCMMVDVANPGRVDQFRAVANGVEIIPANASELAIRLHLNHYPVLISKGRVEQ